MAKKQYLQPTDTHIQPVYEDEFGASPVRSPEVTEKIAKESVATLLSAMRGRITTQSRIEAAKILAKETAFPQQQEGPKEVHLHWHTVDKALRKAGLMIPIQSEVAEDE